MCVSDNTYTYQKKCGEEKLELIKYGNVEIIDQFLIVKSNSQRALLDNVGTIKYTPRDMQNKIK
jgi:hypothetical protein